MMPEQENDRATEIRRQKRPAEVTRIANVQPDIVVTRSKILHIALWTA